jgi:hypothetical protein
VPKLLLAGAALAAASFWAGQPASAGGRDVICCDRPAYIHHSIQAAPRRGRAYRYPPFWAPPVHLHVYDTGHPSPGYLNERLRYLHSRYIFP